MSRRHLDFADVRASRRGASAIADGALADGALADGALAGLQDLAASSVGSVRGACVRRAAASPWRRAAHRLVPSA